MRDLLYGLTWIRGSESTTWLAPTRSIRKPNFRQKASVMAVSCARSPQPRTLLLLQRKEIAESKRNRSELRVHRVHESDMGSAGCLRGLWLNWKSLYWRHCGSDCPARD